MPTSKTEEMSDSVVMPSKENERRPRLYSKSAWPNAHDAAVTESGGGGGHSHPSLK